MAKRTLICLVILLLAMSAACSSKGKTTPATALSTGTPPPTAATRTSPNAPVSTASPSTKAPALRIRTTGRLSFVQDVKLTFGMTGTVARVNVSLLDRVTRGQVLASLDTTSLEESVKAAELAKNAAEFAARTAANALVSAQTDNSTMQQNFISAGIDLAQAQDNLNKITYPYTYHTVYIDVPTALGFINDAKLALASATEALKSGQTDLTSSNLQQALDNLSKSTDLLNRRGTGIDPFGNQNLSMDKFWTLRTTEYQLGKAQVAVQNAKNAASKSALAIETAKIALDKANNDVATAQNNLNIARDSLQKAIVTAPFDGVVGAVNVKVFDVLSSGTFATTTAVEIFDPGSMELDVKVTELDIPSVKPGQKVNITVDALPNVRIEGTVSTVGTLPVSDSGLILFPVAITFNLPQNSGLKAGMNARAEIVTE
jgi:HlyD family secretion protein